MAETVRFQGEDDWEAIVNHNSMDIVEEDEFLKYCEAHGVPWELEHLEIAYRDFLNQSGGEWIVPQQGALNEHRET